MNVDIPKEGVKSLVREVGDQGKREGERRSDDDDGDDGDKHQANSNDCSVSGLVPSLCSRTPPNDRPATPTNLPSFCPRTKRD
jgi:hypothetical protein